MPTVRACVVLLVGVALCFQLDRAASAGEQSGEAVRRELAAAFASAKVIRQAWVFMEVSESDAETEGPLKHIEYFREGPLVAFAAYSASGKELFRMASDGEVLASWEAKTGGRTRMPGPLERNRDQAIWRKCCALINASYGYELVANGEWQLEFTLDLDGKEARVALQTAADATSPVSWLSKEAFGGEVRKSEEYVTVSTPTVRYKIRRGDGVLEAIYPSSPPGAQARLLPTEPKLSIQAWREVVGAQMKSAHAASQMGWRFSGNAAVCARILARYLKADPGLATRPARLAGVLDILLSTLHADEWINTELARVTKDGASKEDVQHVSEKLWWVVKPPLQHWILSASGLSRRDRGLVSDEVCKWIQSRVAQVRATAAWVPVADD